MVRRLDKEGLRLGSHRPTMNLKMVHVDTVEIPDTRVRVEVQVR